MNNDVRTQIVPVFPLSGAVLLPNGYLPLNIFEPRYIAMIDDAMKESRIIGMIQPHCNAESGKCKELYDTGCLGKITSFHETEHGHYLITLTGLTRFKVKEETPCQRGYRKMLIDTTEFMDDCVEKPHGELDWSGLHKKLQHYFDMADLDIDMEVLAASPKAKMLSVLSMVCPFSPSEKQALLEANSCAERFALFTKIVDIAIQTECNNQSVKH